MGFKSLFEFDMWLCTVFRLKMSSDGDSEHFQFGLIDNQYPVQGDKYSSPDDGQLAADIPHNNRPPSVFLPQQGSINYSRFEQILEETENNDTISDIPYHVREEVKDSLNTMKENRKDWRGVASRMGLKPSTIEKIKKDFKEDPTQKVFQEISNQKITKLLQVLYQMDCHDVLKIFYDNICINIPDTGAGGNREKYQMESNRERLLSQESIPDSSNSSTSEFIAICPEPNIPFNTQEDNGTPESLEGSTTASELQGNIFPQTPHSRPKAVFFAKQNTDKDLDGTPTASEYEQRRKEVSDEIFDGFICYAREDRRFALEILTRLEAPPYCRKICIDYRNYVPGNCGLDQTAKIIEHRCKHIVAILSPNFTNSSNADFQVRIALNLSPDFDQRRMIPILYESCDIPEILKPIYHLNYEDSSDHPYFWKKLAIALGYSEPEKPKGSPLIDKKGVRVIGSPRGSPCMDKKSNESPLVDTKNKEILEKTESPSTETKSRGGLFNIVKSNNITINEEGGCFHVPVASAFFLFPPNAVEEEVTLMCSRVKLKYKESEVKPRDGEVFVSRILKVEPEGLTFKKPVTVLLSHSLYEDQDFLYFYELIVKNLSQTEWQELQTERISSIKDVPKEISNKKILEDYLPFAKSTIHETCTLVAATRARFNQILIPTNKRYAFSKQYGDNAELKITFPPGVTEKILILTVQLFPADAVLNRGIRSDKNLVCVPIIKVSGQKTPFLKAVDIELIYSHSDVGSIEEEFLPVGKRVKFTTEYGLLLRSHKETESTSDWQALNDSNDVYIERSRKDQLKFSFSVEHFCYILSFVKKIFGCILPLWSSDMVEVNNPACHSAIALAVHKTNSSPKTLHAVLAPTIALNDVKTFWNVEKKIRKFDEPLKSKEPIYFCVPLSDDNDDRHLLLKDHKLKFDPDPLLPLVLDNNTDDNLNGKYMHFLTDRDCNNGENHSTQGDCHAKAPIHISETISIQASTERHEVMLGSESPQDFSTPSFEQKIISIDDLSVDKCRIGRVTSVTPYGVRMDIGVVDHDGLLHKTVIPPFKDFQTGDTYCVVCTNVDKTNKRIALRLK